MDLTIGRQDFDAVGTGFCHEWEENTAWHFRKD